MSAYQEPFSYLKTRFTGSGRFIVYLIFASRPEEIPDTEVLLAVYGLFRYCLVSSLAEEERGRVVPSWMRFPSISEVLQTLETGVRQ